MMTEMDDRTLEEIATRLAAARRVLFITGAGLSADSGLPTYRGIGGLYEQVATSEGIPIEVAVSGVMFRRDPALTWRYLAQMERACRGARANRGHRVVAEIETGETSVCVLTQNVDGFHVAAGSTNVIEIHGDIHRLVCTECRYAERVTDYGGLEIPPACPECGGLVRPAVVLFGEMLPGDAVTRLYAELARGFDLVFTVGTTSVFPYIAEPVVRARRAGVPTVEINPGRSEVTDLVDFRLAERAAPALDAIWNLCQRRR